MDTNRLYSILGTTTRQFRKGEQITQKTVGGMRIMDVYAMPHESEAADGVEKVDCHFVVVGVDKKEAERRKDELVEVLKTYPEPERLAGGPSYIEVGAEIGDQGSALELFALGQVLGMWKVLTPKEIGVYGPEADDLAGRGFVLMSGWKSK